MFEIIDEFEVERFWVETRTENTRWKKFARDVKSLKSARKQRSDIQADRDSAIKSGANLNKLEYRIVKSITSTKIEKVE